MKTMKNITELLEAGRAVDLRAFGKLLRWIPTYHFFNVRAWG